MSILNSCNRIVIIRQMFHNYIIVTMSIFVFLWEIFCNHFFSESCMNFRNLLTEMTFKVINHIPFTVECRCLMHLKMDGSILTKLCTTLITLIVNTLCIINFLVFLANVFLYFVNCLVDVSRLIYAKH